MAKTLPLNAFIELAAGSFFQEYMDGGNGSMSDLNWPAVIYGISEDVLARKVRRKFDVLKEEYQENFNQHPETNE